MSNKTALTFEEKITAAHLHYVRGIDQHIIAFAPGVNMGRVNEACVTIRKALGRLSREKKNELKFPEPWQIIQVDPEN